LDNKVSEGTGCYSKIQLFNLCRLSTVGLSRSKDMQPNSIITSWEGLDILCRYKRRTAECTLFEQKRNEEILKELTVEPADEKQRIYKPNWLRRVTRMNKKRMSKIMLNCRQNGRRRLGRSLKRLLDEGETGLSRPNSWRMMIMMMIN